ncbi:MAG: hypothetical protein ACI841_002650 [Planctomycetota bacterium]|jgi:hypothetical protein
MLRIEKRSPSNSKNTTFVADRVTGQYLSFDACWTTKVYAPQTRLRNSATKARGSRRTSVS